MISAEPPPTMDPIGTTPKRRLAGFLSVLKYGGIITATIALIRFTVPNVAVTVGDPHRPSDPTTTPFVVRNDGFLPISKLGLGCSINQAILEHGVVLMGPSPVFKEPKTPFTLSSGDATTTYCSFEPTIRDADWIYLDVTLVVTFHATWIRPRKAELYRFIGERWDSVFVWVPRGLNEELGPRGGAEEQRWLEAVVDSTFRVESIENFFQDVQKRGSTRDATATPEPTP